MPGYCFSPTLRNHEVTVFLKNGTQLSGKVVDVNTSEIVLQQAGNKQVHRVNRDEVVSHTGSDDRDRHPFEPRLIVTRCCNTVMRCNGVKNVGVKKVQPDECKMFNEHCEVYEGDFFSMSRTAMCKLLDGVRIGSYPSPDNKEEKR